MHCRAPQGLRSWCTTGSGAREGSGWAGMRCATQPLAGAGLVRFFAFLGWVLLDELGDEEA